MFTPIFPWEDMLEELAKLSIVSSHNYRLSLKPCNQSFRFIQITLDRLEASSTIANGYQETLNKIMTDPPLTQNDAHPLLTEHEQVYDLYMKTLEEIKLDYENFFLHARILMDRLCYLTRFLFPRDNLPYRTFNRHREYFLMRHAIPNYLKGYSEYMAQNSGWFGLLLKTTRDFLIVHSKPFLITAMISGKTGRPRPLMINWDSSVVNHYFPLVKNIRAHYPGDKPLQDEDNFWNMIEILSNMQLSRTDELELTRIIGSVGTTLPRLDVICSGILGYVKALLSTRH